MFFVLVTKTKQKKYCTDTYPVRLVCAGSNTDWGKYTRKKDIKTARDADESGEVDPAKLFFPPFC